MKYFQANTLRHSSFLVRHSILNSGPWLSCYFC